MTNDSNMGSAYMNWAKTGSAARFNLTNSGLANLQLQQLNARLEDLEITSEYGYGYPPLVNALAARMRVGPESIVTAAGTSFANHLALAAMVNPGDEILIEHPTYEPLLALLHYLGATVKRFPRLMSENFQISLPELDQAISERTKLVIITNLNNPTGVMTDLALLSAIGKMARRVGAKVLVDEVYLETFFASRPPTAFRLGPEFVVTSSLTKAFGLSGLRCGWIVAEPDLARKMWLLNDLFASTPVHAGERLSVIALEQIDALSRLAAARLETNRSLVQRFLASREDLETVQPAGGTVFFPRLKSVDTEKFCSLLREKYETSVVPGRFFEMPEHFRIGIGGDSETLAAGLVRIEHALDELRVSNLRSQI
jgi:aspartate/methionine/tyrosine aminotransferase